MFLLFEAKHISSGDRRRKLPCLEVTLGPSSFPSKGQMALRPAFGARTHTKNVGCVLLIPEPWEWVETDRYLMLPSQPE